VRLLADATFNENEKRCSVYGLMLSTHTGGNRLRCQFCVFYFCTQCRSQSKSIHHPQNERFRSGPGFESRYVCLMIGD
jgi:hypothetical protein